MWNFFENSRFDRPRRIEREELRAKYTRNIQSIQGTFFEEFRMHYITEAEIRDMAELGYNSVRIRIHWRLLKEEDEEIIFKETGFQMIDQCLDWGDMGHRVDRPVPILMTASMMYPDSLPMNTATISASNFGKKSHEDTRTATSLAVMIF